MLVHDGSSLRTAHSLHAVADATQKASRCGIVASRFSVDLRCGCGIRGSRKKKVINAEKITQSRSRQKKGTSHSPETAVESESYEVGLRRFRIIITLDGTRKILDEEVWTTAKCQV